jgi:hypothetical protein
VPRIDVLPAVKRPRSAWQRVSIRLKRHLHRLSLIERDSRIFFPRGVTKSIFLIVYMAEVDLEAGTALFCLRVIGATSRG